MCKRLQFILLTFVVQTIFAQVVVRDSVEIQLPIGSIQSFRGIAKSGSTHFRISDATISSKTFFIEKETACGSYTNSLQVPLVVVDIVPGNYFFDIIEGNVTGTSPYPDEEGDEFVEGDLFLHSDVIHYQINGNTAEFYYIGEPDGLVSEVKVTCPNPDWDPNLPDPYWASPCDPPPNAEPIPLKVYWYYHPYCYDPEWVSSGSLLYILYCPCYGIFLPNPQYIVYS